MPTNETDEERRSRLLERVAELRAEQIARGYTPGHDRSHGVHGLIIEAGRRTSTSECGYYHIDDMLVAASLLIAAAELTDRLHAANDSVGPEHDGPHGYRGKAKV